MEPLRLPGSEELGACRLLLGAGLVSVPSFFGVTLPSLRALAGTRLLSFTLPARPFLSVCSPQSLELDAAEEAGSSPSCSLALGGLALSALTSLTDVSGEVCISVKVSCPK